MKAKGLATVRMLPTPDDDVVVIALEDTGGKTARFAIGPEGLNALLAPALGLATRWADKSDLEVDTLFGPKNALPATAVAFQPGREPTEAAIRVLIGKVELSFLIPLDKLLKATLSLAPLVEPNSPNAAH